MLHKLYLMLNDSEKSSSRRETAVFVVSGVCTWLEFDESAVKRIAEVFTRELERKIAN